MAVANDHPVAEDLNYQAHSMMPGSLDDANLSQKLMRPIKTMVKWC